VTNQELRVGVCAGTVVTKHTWDVAGQIEALTGVPIELVTVRVSRDVHAYTEDNVVNTMRAALRNDVCDLVVHCLDEVPIPDAADLIYITPQRASVKEALCTPTGDKLAELPRGSRVSVDTNLRVAGLRALRPDLEPVMTHGSLAHRINQLFEPGSDLDAALASYADLLTIGRTELVTEVLEPVDIPPMAGQGAIAIETRRDYLAANPWLGRAFARMDDPATRLGIRAERALLSELAGRISDPIGAWGRLSGDHLLLGAAIIGDGDGYVDGQATAAQQYRHRGYAPIPDLTDRKALTLEDLDELNRVADELGHKVAAHLLELGAGGASASAPDAVASADHSDQSDRPMLKAA